MFAIANGLWGGGECRCMDLRWVVFGLCATLWGIFLGGLFTSLGDLLLDVVQIGRSVVGTFYKKVCICGVLLAWETFRIVVTRGSLFW